MSNLIYYEHYYCSRNDIKIIRLNKLLRKYGSKHGYALFHATLEVMLELDGYAIYENDIDIIAQMVGESVDIYTQFIDFAVEIGLLQRENGLIVSRRFLDWALRKTEIRQKNAENGRTGGRPRKQTEEHGAVTPETEQSVMGVSDVSVTKLKANVKPVLSETAVNVKAVFDHWNGKQIKVHREISEPLKQALKQALKKFSAEQICGAIDAYAKRLSDPADFWEYRWTLLEFITRKNALPIFAELSQNTEQAKQQKALESVKTQSCEAQKRLDESALISDLSARLWSSFGSLRDLLGHIWKFPTPESKTSYIETMPARLQQIVTAPDSMPLRVMRQGVNENLANEYETIKTEEITI